MGSLNGSDGVNDQHGCRCAFANEKARSKRALDFGRELLLGPRYGKVSFAEVIVVFLVVVTSTRWHEIQLAWPGNAQECMSEWRFYQTILNSRCHRGPRRREANGWFGTGKWPTAARPHQGPGRVADDGLDGWSIDRSQKTVSVTASAFPHFYTVEWPQAFARLSDRRLG